MAVTKKVLKCVKGRPWTVALAVVLVALAAYLVYRAVTNPRVEGWTFDKPGIEPDESNPTHRRHIEQVKKLCGQGWTWKDVQKWDSYAHLYKYNGDILYDDYCKPAQDAITAEAKNAKPDTVSRRQSKCRPDRQCPVALLKASRPCLNEDKRKCCRREWGIRKKDGKEGWVLRDCAWRDRAEVRDNELTGGSGTSSGSGSNNGDSSTYRVYADAGQNGSYTEGTVDTSRDSWCINSDTFLGKSSMQVPAGWKAEIFTVKNCGSGFAGATGKGYTLTEQSAQDFRKVNSAGDYNDKIRSIRFKRA